VSQSSYSLGSATCFDFPLDGQTIRHSSDEGTNWHTIYFSQWPSLINKLVESLEDKIAMQLPEGLEFSSLLTAPLADDLSRYPPHLQVHNNHWMVDSSQLLKRYMLSSSESQHCLTSNGDIQQLQLNRYLQRDQEIRGLIAALVATTTSVCLRPSQFESILIGSNATQQRNIWLLYGRFVLVKPAAKQRSIHFADTLY
jgi:hypothetical protein